MTYEQAQIELLPGDRVRAAWDPEPYFGTVVGWKNGTCEIKWDAPRNTGWWNQHAKWEAVTRLPTREELFKQWLKFAVPDMGIDFSVTVNDRAVSLSGAFTAGFDYGVQSQIGIKAAQEQNDVLCKKIVSLENQLANATESVRDISRSMDLLRLDLNKSESARSFLTNKLQKINELIR